MLRCPAHKRIRQMVVIPLSEGLFAVVDDADAQRVGAFKWKALRSKSGHVCAFATVNRHVVYMHRLVVGADKGQLVDHINGNPLDNRRSNLRICTHAENMQNRRKHSNNTTGFTGVVFLPKKNRFRARITAFGREYHLGTFRTAEEAAEVMAAKVLELHGRFARVS